MIIEFDGIHFHKKVEQLQRDQKKTEHAQNMGYTLFRFKEGEDNALIFFNDIKEWIDERIKNENQENN